MKSEIIITINDERGDIKYDLEVPTDVTVEKLVEDIKEVLCSYDRNLIYAQQYSRLYSERLQTDLPNKDTLGHIGIWTGDILMLK